MIRPDSAWNMAGSELSINSLVQPNEYPSGKFHLFYFPHKVGVRLTLFQPKGADYDHRNTNCFHMHPWGTLSDNSKCVKYSLIELLTVPSLAPAPHSTGIYPKSLFFGKTHIPK